MDAQSQEYLVRNLGRFYTIDELKNTVVAYRNNTAIRLGDVANVEFGAKNQTRRCRLERQARRDYVGAETAGRKHDRIDRKS